MRNFILILTALMVLTVVNFNIFQSEQLSTQGRLVLLELAPVDPRSLMQGDYMGLRFKVADQAFQQQDLKSLNDGSLVLSLDDKNRASFSRFAESSTLAENELLFRYRIRNGRVVFATNAFFFQEGEAKTYAPARYGEFRVSADGESILTQLRDKDLALLGTGSNE